MSTGWERRTMVRNKSRRAASTYFGSNPPPDPGNDTLSELPSKASNPLWSRIDPETLHKLDRMKIRLHIEENRRRVEGRR